MSYVELKDVTKVYQMGEVAVIVGPSGAGKTTVLNILGGMDTASGGTVMVDGQDVSAFRGRDLIRYRREDIGFVFQFYNLMQNLTALENVELALQICSFPAESSRGWLSPEHWRRTRVFCSVMNLRERWTM